MPHNNKFIKVELVKDKQEQKVEKKEINKNPFNKDESNIEKKASSFKVSRDPFNKNDDKMDLQKDVKMSDRKVV